MTAVERSEIQFGRTRIGYQVRRSPRRRTVAVAVDRSAGVVLTAPDKVSIERLDRVVHDKARWILERLRRVREAEADLPAREFVSGESYLYLGRSYRLKVAPRSEPGGVRLSGGRLHVAVDRAGSVQARADEARRALECWYRRHASERLSERVAIWAKKLGISAPRVVIRDQQQRWGSCDGRGVLRFNWRIVQAPMRLVDYVVVHELVHLGHREHTRAFWARLGRAMPDLDRRREELRRMGARLEW